MSPKVRFLLILFIIIALGAITAICLHALEEIHYLKSFFPRSFTVQEAFYAGALELVKVVIISIPLVLLVIICLVLLKRDKR